MNRIDRLLAISTRIDHLENAAEWISRETVHSDSAVSQTSTLISVLADEIRERVFELAKEVEEILDFERLQ
ncbi:MAG: hypothetical protein KDD42_05850 [Bdellovibrionales bacterium]|nr:hypothetical protein [Bdellovibrionales bacterium]